MFNNIPDAKKVAISNWCVWIKKFLFQPPALIRHIVGEYREDYRYSTPVKSTCSMLCFITLEWDKQQNMWRRFMQQLEARTHEKPSIRRSLKIHHQIDKCHSNFFPRCNDKSIILRSVPDRHTLLVIQACNITLSFRNSITSRLLTVDLLNNNANNSVIKCALLSIFKRQ